MIETLRWWLAATVIGLIAAPYAFRVFRFLPDRGLAFARILGILIVVYAMWMLSVLGLLPFGAGAAVLLLSLLAAGGVALAGRDREAIGAHLRTRWPVLVAGEVVFALFLFGIALTRAYEPAIADTEKLFEFAFFNGVLRSPDMPPADPWYGGEPMSYYYGGYLVVALFTRLTGVIPAIAFNLGVALTGGLAALSAYGLGANLVIALRGRGTGLVPAVRSRTAVVAGVVSALLLMVLASTEGVFELAAAHGWGDAAFYRRLGIENLTGPYDSATWYPSPHWWWWKATRMGSSWNITEFPFFSFLLGDLHAHVMVLPFSVLGFALVLNLVRGGALGSPPLQRSQRPRTRSPLLGPVVAAGYVARRGLFYGSRQPLTTLLLGVLAGMLALINSWDQPIFLGLLFAAVLVLNIGKDGLTWAALGHALAFTAPVALLSFLLYIPFFVHLHPATSGIEPIELSHLPEGVNGEGMVFPPHHFLIFWGPLVLIAGGAVILQAARRRVWRAASEDRSLAIALALTPLFLWAAAVTVFRFVDPAYSDLFDEVRTRATWWSFGSYWLVQLTIVGLIGLGILTTLAEARRPAHVRRAGRLYLLLALTMGFALLHVMELFYVKEPTPARTNTLFKFSYTAWLLLATAGGAGLIDAVLAWRRARRPSRLLPLWANVTFSVLLLAFVYPVTAMMSRTNGFTGDTTLDGLAALRKSDPHEYETVVWLASNLKGRPVVLEATGGDYSLGGRISARTGLPTVIGWGFHEAQERGGRDFEAKSAEVARRSSDVDTIYNTGNVDEAMTLLRKHRVAYVVVGQPELEKYGANGGLAKFGEIGHAMYRNRSVTVYAVGAVSDGAAPELRAPR
jgi:YYY domain-containing protein